MAQAVYQLSDKHLPHPEWIDRAVIAVRWFTLVVVFDLSFFDLSTEGVLVPTLHIIVVVGAYNLLILLLRNHLRSRRRVLNVLALDSVIATLAVYLTGGVHSAFFVLNFYVVLCSALYLNLVPTVLVSMLVAVLYAFTCLMNPVGIVSPATANILATKLTVLLVLGLVSALLLEGLRREHFETDREALLAARLAVLNDLFQQLTSSLDLERVLHTIVRACCRLLESDIAIISLLEKDQRILHVAAAEGMDASRLAETRWVIGEEPLRTILARDKAYRLLEPGVLPASVRRLVHEEGIASAISAPLVLDGVPIGFLSVAHRTLRTYTDQDLDLLKPLGQQAALAIRNAHLYEMEKQQVEQLKTLERLQETFVSFVSHELRTPLTSIKTSVALWQETQDGGATAVQQELLHTIANNVGRLEAMVSDLLQMTQLEAGRLELTLQPTDLRAIVERAIQSLRPLFDDKGQEIEFHSPEKMDRVLADRRRLEQVLVNLLSNAHRYAPRGARVRIDLVDKPGEVEFSVKDDGPGIPRPEQERVFDKFYVGADVKNRTGVGLGLYITRGLVELFGGRIWVESEPGRGSTFRFTLPKKELNDEDIDR